MTFKLSSRSLGKLEGVNQLLVDTVISKRKTCHRSEQGGLWSYLWCPFFRRTGEVVQVRTLTDYAQANTLSKKMGHHTLSI